MNGSDVDVKVAMVQMDIANSPQENAKRFLAYARKADIEGADIVVGSEMMLAPYMRGDSYEDDDFVNDMWQAVQKIISASKTIDAILIFGGIGLDEDETLLGQDGRRRKYNAAFVVQNGELIQNRAGLPFGIKTLMPNYRIFDDSRHFFSLRELAEENEIQTAAMLKPFPVKIHGRPYELGVMLCEDMWDMDYSIRPAKALVDNGADILINISCSPWSWQKNRKRDSIIKTICQETNVPFVYVNNVGCQNNGKNFIVFDGSSTAYDVYGNLIAMAKPYQEEFCIVDFELENPSLVRQTEEDVAAMYKAVEVATLGFLKTAPRSLSKVVIGVSGGADSALSAAFFTKLLGAENIIGVNMPYKHYNADETKDDAAELCRRLGIEYRVKPIDKAADAIAEAAEVVPGTPQHKTIQAATRLQMLVGIATKESAWFPCNANMAELFFGYGTLNGDLRGTFSPWMNCLKQDVYRLMEYMNREIFKEEIIPQSIITRPPMDELVAEGEGERNDPFEYGSVSENGYHDQMVRAVVAFRHGPEWFIECYLDGTLEEKLLLSEGVLNKRFATKEEWLEDLERCFSLYYRNIFKHVQSVPGPLLDKRSFGWDFRESIGVDYETERFMRLKAKLLETAQMPNQVEAA